MDTTEFRTNQLTGCAWFAKTKLYQNPSHSKIGINIYVVAIFVSAEERCWRGLSV